MMIKRILSIGVVACMCLSLQAMETGEGSSLSFIGPMPPPSISVSSALPRGEGERKIKKTGRKVEKKTKIRSLTAGLKRAEGYKDAAPTLGEALVGLVGFCDTFKRVEHKMAAGIFNSAIMEILPIDLKALSDDELLNLLVSLKLVFWTIKNESLCVEPGVFGAFIFKCLPLLKKKDINVYAALVPMLIAASVNVGDALKEREKVALLKLADLDVKKVFPGSDATVQLKLSTALVNLKALMKAGVPTGEDLGSLCSLTQGTVFEFYTKSQEALWQGWVDEYSAKDTVAVQTVQEVLLSLLKLNEEKRLTPDFSKKILTTMCSGVMKDYSLEELKRVFGYLALLYSKMPKSCLNHDLTINLIKKVVNIVYRDKRADFSGPAVFTAVVLLSRLDYNSMEFGEPVLVDLLVSMLKSSDIKNKKLGVRGLLYYMQKIKSVNKRTFMRVFEELMKYADKEGVDPALRETVEFVLDFMMPKIVGLQRGQFTKEELARIDPLLKSLREAETQEFSGYDAYREFNKGGKLWG